MRRMRTSSPFIGMTHYVGATRGRGDKHGWASIHSAIEGGRLLSDSQPEICIRCGGALEARTITHRQPWGTELYEFENVPALVCVQCDDVWMSAEVAQHIEQIIRRQ